MYRHRQFVTASNSEAYNEAIALADDVNKLCAERGWIQGTLWTQTVGRNTLVFEFDYPDLATFEREGNEWMRDPATADVNRRLDALSVIPALKITDRGYVDVERFRIVPLTADGDVSA